MKIRLIAALTLCMLLASMLAGCAGGNTPTSTTAAAIKTTSAAITTPADATTTVADSSAHYPVISEPITVTAVGFYNPSYEGDPAEMTYWKALEAITNIHLDWTLVDASNAENSVLYFASGDYADFFFNGINSATLQEYGVEGGIFADLTPYIDECMPNMAAAIQEYPAAGKVIRQTNGEIYSMPRIIMNTTAAVGQIFYRTDYFETLGLEMPTTTTEFYDALVAAANSGLTGDYAPLAPAGFAGFYNQCQKLLFCAFGESVDLGFADDGNGKVVYNYTSEQYMNYLAYVSKLYAEKLLENEVFTIDTSIVNARVRDGNAIFFTNGSVLNPEDFPDGEVHLNCLKPLVSEYTSTMKTPAYNHFSTVGGCILKSSSYIKEIMRMCDTFYATEEVVPGSGFWSLSQNIGILGQDWEYTSDLKNGYRLIVPDDWDKSAWDYVTKYVSWNGLVLLCDMRGLFSENPNNFARETAMVNNLQPYALTPYPESLMKFTPDESSEMANKLTDIKSYVEQMNAKFITGAESLDNWGKYVAEIEKMGINGILTIQQTAYDRWNS